MRCNFKLLSFIHCSIRMNNKFFIRGIKVMDKSVRLGPCNKHNEFEVKFKPCEEIKDVMLKVDVDREPDINFESRNCNFKSRDCNLESRSCNFESRSCSFKSRNCNLDSDNFGIILLLIAIMGIFRYRTFR